MNKKVIASNIRKYRTKKGLTQKQVADKLGMMVQSYQRYEYATSDIKVATLYHISHILDVDINTLVYMEK